MLFYQHFIYCFALVGLADLAAIKHPEMHRSKLVCGADVEIFSRSSKSDNNNMLEKSGSLRLYEVLYPEDQIVVFGLLNNLNKGHYTTVVAENVWGCEAYRTMPLVPNHIPALKGTLGQFTIKSEAGGESAVYINSGRAALGSILGSNLVILAQDGSWTGCGVIREMQSFPCYH